MVMITSILSLAVPKEAGAAVDVDSIAFLTKKMFRAGTPETNPYDIGAKIYGNGIDSIRIISPTGITEFLTTDGSNGWFWDREVKYPTLAALHLDFPPGDYVFIFNEGEVTEDSATVLYDPEEPTGFADITYPLDGAINVPETPTFTWASCSDYGDSLLAIVEDEFTDSDIYFESLDITQTSWTPGPLVLGRSYYLSVLVQKARPVQILTTDIGDTFNYYDTFFWRNEVKFTIIPAVELLSGWIWLPDVPDIGYSIDEGDWLYFYHSVPVLAYNFTTGQWLLPEFAGLFYVDWPFWYEIATGHLWFLLPPESGLPVYHFSTGQWEVLPRIIPW